YYKHSPTDYDIQYFSCLLKFVLYHNYLFQGNRLYRKIIGIPQGNKTSCILPNLYLFRYEKNHNFAHHIISRYIDDVIDFKLDPNAPDITLDFYPSCLELIVNDLPD